MILIGTGERRHIIEPAHPKLLVTEQCKLLGLTRSNYYHQPLPESDENQRLTLMIDEMYLAQPFYDLGQMTRALRRQGHKVDRKRIRGLMRLMGLEALAPKPRLSAADQAQRIYPYLLRDLATSSVIRPSELVSVVTHDPTSSADPH